MAYLAAITFDIEEQRDSYTLLHNKSNLAAKAGNEEMITRLLLSSRSREMLLLLRMLLG